MRKTHLVLVTGVALLSVVMFGLNLHLYKLNRQIKNQLDVQINNQELTSAPMPGWTMPHLKGKETNGTPVDIDLQASAPKMTLLLFDPQSCAVCDENWTYWNRLRNDPEIGTRFIPATIATSIPEDYRDRHQIVRHFFVMGMNPEMLKQMRMLATPQTIYMESGIVKKVWFGLLSDDDVKEISRDMQMDE